MNAGARQSTIMGRKFSVRAITSWSALSNFTLWLNMRQCLLCGQAV